MSKILFEGVVALKRAGSVSTSSGEKQLNSSQDNIFCVTIVICIETSHFTNKLLLICS